MNNDPVQQLAAVLAAMGWTTSDLDAAIRRMKSEERTLAEVLHKVEEGLQKPVAWRYPLGRKYVLEGHPPVGDLEGILGFANEPYTNLTFTVARDRKEQLRRLVAADKLSRAADRGRPLAVSDPRAHGQGSTEQYVRALRHISKTLTEAGWFSRDPLARLVPDPRSEGTRDRALTVAESRRFAEAVLLGSPDPILDALLWIFLRLTAARKLAVLALAPAGVNPERPSAVILGKMGASVECPVSAPLLRSMRGELCPRQGREPRHGQPRVFATRNGAAIDRNYFNAWSTRLKSAELWAQGHTFGIKCLRATTARMIEEGMGGFALGSALFLGHSVDHDLGTIAAYLDSPHRDHWSLRRGIAETAFGPLEAWPVLPENDLLHSIIDVRKWS